MKRKVLIIITLIVVLGIGLFVWIGGRENNPSSDKESSSNSKMSNDIIKVDGLYLNITA